MTQECPALYDETKPIISILISEKVIYKQYITGKIKQKLLALGLNLIMEIDYT